MSKPNMEPAKVEINLLDIKIVIAIGICILTSTILGALGIKFSYGEMRLDIIQKATAAISCLLVTQDGLGASKGAGIMRIKVTLMAGITALVIVSLDSFIANQWISIILVMLGVLITMYLCKLVKAPYMNCRIGGVNFVLMAVTMAGQARIVYTAFRIVSTIYGVLAVLLVTWIFGLFVSKKNH